MRGRILVDVDIYLQACHVVGGGERCRNCWAVVPLELLALGSLGVLDTGCSFALVEEATNVLYAAHRNFVQNVFTVCDKGLADKLIAFLKIEEEMRQLVGLFERVGHLGCVRSQLCAHHYVG